MSQPVKPSTAGEAQASPAWPRGLRLAVCYRVCYHYRMPAFIRMANWPGIQFKLFHGPDAPGTRAVNTRDFSGIDHHQMWTIICRFSAVGERVGIPFSPLLPFHLWAFRPHVILAEGGSNMFNNFLIFPYAFLTRTPIVWWTLGELRKDKPLSRSQRLFRRIVTWMERRAAALLGYSSMAIDYFDQCGYPKEKQFRAVNCVDTDQVQAEMESTAGQVEALRAKLGLAGKRVLLYVGAITPLKRLEDLIEVYAQLKLEEPDLALLIVGDGVHTSKLKDAARDTGAADIIFAGKVIEGVSAYFQLGDIFVLPGLGGLAISQAMVHSLPVISTEADGCEIDLVEDGRNGYLLPVGDRTRLRQALKGMLDDPARLQAMKEHSRWIIDHRHNIHTYMENVMAAVAYAYDGKRRVPVPTRDEPR